MARAGHGLLGPWRQNISPGTCPISPDLRSRVTDLVITWFAAPPRLRAMGWAGALTEGTPNVRAAGSLRP